ncbi:MAG: hypothetical protein JW925_00655 [Syntrophaceae bacterium]|nr:hypothetical protein [Syntrophaceae bacterium]
MDLLQGGNYSLKLKNVMYHTDINDNFKINLKEMAMRSLKVTIWWAVQTRSDARHAVKLEL